MRAVARGGGEHENGCVERQDADHDHACDAAPAAEEEDADEDVRVREGVRALRGSEADFEVVAVAADYDELIARAEEHVPHVLVTDIRMPPNFQSEGIDAAKEVRKRNPGTGVVILSQYDDPEYAIALLAEGQDGYAYLLKDRVGEGDQLAHAIRT